MKRIWKWNDGNSYEATLIVDSITQTVCIQIFDCGKTEIVMQTDFKTFLEGKYQEKVLSSFDQKTLSELIDFLENI